MLCEGVGPMSEGLYVPEEHLVVVCRVIRRGLEHSPRVPRDVRQQLLKWCKEMEEYMREQAE